MSSYNSRVEAFWPKVITGVSSLVIYTICSFAYHKYATSTQDITNATITDKKLSSHSVKTGKYSRRQEPDHYIYTDKGLLREEKSGWDGKDTEGIMFDTLKIGGTYNFRVNHDNITGENNILKAEVYNGPQY